jgi:hypothetical protein
VDEFSQNTEGNGFRRCTPNPSTLPKKRWLQDGSSLEKNSLLHPFATNNFLDFVDIK